MSLRIPHCLRLFSTLLAALIFLAFHARASAQTATLTTLTRFSGTSGYHPTTAMVVGADGNFYGTTRDGGTYNGGTFFQITAAGVLTVLHHFSLADGTKPSVPLILGTDGNFYGATSYGGANNTGTVFQVTPAGVLTVLYNATADKYGVGGVNPLALGADGNLYGIAAYVDAASDSAFFRLTLQGKFTILHAFPTGNSGVDENIPTCLVRGTDGNFYGTTGSGGDGAIVRITPAGVLTTVYNFNFNDGYDPYNLTLGRDGNFYGITSQGGTSDYGTVFECTPAGVFTVLASFPSNSGAISFQNPPLAEGSDGNFYGALEYYGFENEDGVQGALYQVTPAGTFTILHAFSGTDGNDPEGGLVSGPDGKLYGTTTSGGTSLAYGTVFSFTNTGTLTSLYSFTGPNGSQPAYGLADGHDGNFYGTTTTGGTSNDGVLFAVTPLGALNVLHNFAGSAASGGAKPSGALFPGSDGDLYGTTGSGGAKRSGVIFQATRSGTVHPLYNLAPIASDLNNAYETGSVVQGRDGNFYVTNSIANDDADGSGDIYRFAPGGSVTLLSSFEEYPENDSNLSGPLVEGADGNYYGTATDGGDNENGAGAVFQLTPAGTVKNIHAFVYAQGDLPEGGLIIGPDGKFYGMTTAGGTNGGGAFFSITTAGVLTTLHNYSGTGSDLAPNGFILGSDGNFYGTTYSGGASGEGTIFTMTPTGKLTVLSHFDGSNGTNPVGRLVEGADGNFYGLTADAQSGYGTVFQLNLHGIVAFAATSYPVNENAGSVTLTVARTGSTTGAIAVNYATVNGTAVAGTDYQSQAGTLSWADGDATSRTIVVPITDRLITGGSTVSFTVALSQPTGGAALGNPAAATVNIVESDAVPVVNVVAAGDGKAQYGVEKGKVVFQRTGDLSAALTVFYKVKGTAEAGVDYKVLAGQLVIPAGAAQAKIKIKPLDDPSNTGKLKAKIVVLPPTDGSYTVGDSRLAKIVILGTGK